MKLLTVLLCLLPALAAAALPPSQPPASSERPPSQVLVEGGVTVPKGDLGADFHGDPLGFGAHAGMELGFRWRLFLSPSLSVSPGFHFSDFRNLEGTNDDLGDYRVESSIYSWTVELMWHPGSRDAVVRPFAAVAAGLYRNRLVGYTKTFERSLDESINALGFNGRAGLALGELEFSVVYHVNRFSTWRLFDTGVDQDYNWDCLGARAAWVLPFGD